MMMAGNKRSISVSYSTNACIHSGNFIEIRTRYLPTKACI